MRELTLIVTDLFIDKDAAGPASVPPLPALSQLLACARVEMTGDWRRWVLLEFAAANTGQVPVAAISHGALSAREAASDSRVDWWLATPVHLDADLTCVRMGARPLELAEDEWQCVRTEFNHLFGKDGFQLDAATRAGAFLAASDPIDAVTTDPVRILGQNIEPSLPSGIAGPLLRRMMTGIQMWLHGHPLNEARAQQGMPTANALWVWGGGQPPVFSSPVILPRLFSGDLFLHGLWGTLRGDIDARPVSLASVMAETPSGRALVTLSILAGSRSPVEMLEDMDRNWLAPALRALRVGRIGRLALHLNDRLFRASRLDSLRFWRRHRHWLEVAV